MLDGVFIWAFDTTLFVSVCVAATNGKQGVCLSTKFWLYVCAKPLGG
jgi:hypothetical protein